MSGFRKGWVVSGGAGLFQESLGGFRKGYVFHERLGVASGWVVVSGSGFRRGLVVSGKSGVFPGKAAWFQERLRSFRKGCGVSRKCVSHMMLEV